MVEPNGHPLSRFCSPPGGCQDNSARHGRSVPAVATYLELADALERALVPAQVGERVASEHELVAAHGISRPTARAALQELERRFIVRRVRGAGTFVNRRIDYVIGSDRAPSFTETVSRAGGIPGARLLDVQTRRATREVRDDLGLATGTSVVVLARIVTVDGQVAGVITSHLPAALVAGLASHLLAEDGALSVDALLRSRYGLRPRRAWSRASLDVPPASIAAHLGLDAAVPSWCIESCNDDERTGARIERSTSWNRADALRVVFELGTRP